MKETKWEVRPGLEVGLHTCIGGRMKWFALRSFGPSQDGYFRYKHEGERVTITCKGCGEEFTSKFVREHSC